jgi:hypothetical protein
MGRQVVFITNYTATSADRTSKGISASVDYNQSTSSSIPTTWGTWNKDVLMSGFLSSAQFFNCRVRLNNTHYDLADVITNAKVYKLSKNVNLNENTDTYQTALAKINSDTDKVEYPISSNNAFTVRRNNTQESNGYTTIVRGNGQQGTNEYWVCIFPENWYRSLATTKRTLTQTLTNCTSNTIDGDVSVDSFTVVLTAIQGYEFNSLTVTGATYSVSYSTDNTVATITINSGSDGDAISITANATPIPIVKRTLTQTLTNCTSDTNDGDVSVNGFTVTLTCNSDCTFDSVAVNGATYSVAYNSTNTVATITIDSGSDGDSITISASAIQHTFYNFTATITNGSCSIPNGRYEDGTQLSAVVSPTVQGYLIYTFKNPPVCNDGTAVVNYDSATDSYTFTFTITQNTTIIGTAERYATLNLTSVINADCNFTENDKLFKNTVYHITLNALTGYYFDTPPTLIYRDSHGVPHEGTFTAYDTTDYHQSYYYDFSFSSDTEATTITIRGSAVAIPISDKLGLVTMYLPTMQQLDDLAQQRYIGGSGTTIYTDDLGEYIVSMFRIYVNVPIDASQEIVLGMHNTGIISNISLHDTVTIDCGEVEIEPYFNNVMDYTNTFIKMYLPLYGMVTLDAVDVVGKTINLKYRVNIVNGDTLILISADDELVVTYQSNCSYEVPYILNRDNAYKGRLALNANYLYGFIPFIEVIRNRAYNTSDVVAPDNRYMLLGELVGYNEIELIDTPLNIATNEVKQIKQLLSEGVIF